MERPVLVGVPVVKGLVLVIVLERVVPFVLEFAVVAVEIVPVIVLAVEVVVIVIVKVVFLINAVVPETAPANVMETGVPVLVVEVDVPGVLAVLEHVLAVVKINVAVALVIVLAVVLVPPIQEKKLLWNYIQSNDCLFYIHTV